MPSASSDPLRQPIAEHGLQIRCGCRSSPSERSQRSCQERGGLREQGAHDFALNGENREEAERQACRSAASATPRSDLAVGQSEQATVPHADQPARWMHTRQDSAEEHRTVLVRPSSTRSIAAMLEMFV